MKLPPKPIKQRQVKKVQIDKSKAWGFFDGASRGNPALYGAGGLLHIKGDHWLSYKCWLSQASNSWAELQAISILLSLAVELSIEIFNCLEILDL